MAGNFAEEGTHSYVAASKNPARIIPIGFLFWLFCPSVEQFLERKWVKWKLEVVAVCI